jgi:hypothetical protein
MTTYHYYIELADILSSDWNVLFYSKYRTKINGDKIKAYYWKAQLNDANLKSISCGFTTSKDCIKNLINTLNTGDNNTNEKNISNTYASC